MLNYKKLRLGFSLRLSILPPLLLVSLSSFIRFFGAKSHIIDYNYPPLQLSYISLLLFIAGSAWLAYISFLNFRANSRISELKAAVFLIPILVAPPSTTNDLQVYNYQGYFLHQNIDPYKAISLKDREENPFYQVVSVQYREIKSKYGPIWIGISALASALGSFYSMYFYKLINFGVLLFLLHYDRKLKFQYTWLWLSALGIVEIIGQGHNDLLSIAACFVLLNGYSTNNGFKNGLFALLIPLTKMLYFPFMFINLLKLFNSNRKSFYISLLVQITGLCAWYLIHKSSLISSFKTGVSMRPSGSWADVFYELGRILLNENFDHRVSSIFFQLLGLFLFSIVSVAAVSKKGINFRVLSSILIFGCMVYFSIFIPRLFPWYLLFFIPLFGSLNTRQKSLFFILSFFSVIQGSMHLFNPDLSVTPVILITSSTFLSLLTMLFILKLQIKELLSDNKPAPSPN